ncbi:hypothetical protein IW261DRAFT_1479251 [Armillaria novae-zelandiae]|uniref:Uncharacterized protein n=1 Tax=Armillaria novae-zelandiae TaxID=153914 RepID=A0AA39UAD7_9AGAR|nr:hypothetical protein IW261DRAFT_1479251 [Armillaria novae-zelandiae]
MMLLLVGRQGEAIMEPEVRRRFDEQLPHLREIREKDFVLELVSEVQKTPAFHVPSAHPSHRYRIQAYTQYPTYIHPNLVLGHGIKVCWVLRALEQDRPRKGRYDVFERSGETLRAYVDSEKDEQRRAFSCPISGSIHVITREGCISNTTLRSGCCLQRILSHQHEYHRRRPVLLSCRRDFPSHANFEACEGSTSEEPSPRQMIV